MSDLRVIYTPNAGMFREKYPASPRLPGEAESMWLRLSYERLKTRLGGLPQVIGVVTYNRAIRQLARYAHSLIEDPTTTYTPAAVFEKVLEWGDADFTDARASESAYRNISAALIPLSLVWPEEKVRLAGLLACVPKIGFVNELVPDLADEARRLVGQVGRPAWGADALVDVFATQGSWDRVEEVYGDITADFESNRVSARFPLNYCMLDTVVPPIEFSRVDLSRGREPVGASGFLVDAFGTTRNVETFEGLLQTLPEEKTIITDLYLVSHFPELRNADLQVEEHLARSALCDVPEIARLCESEPPPST